MSNEQPIPGENKPTTVTVTLEYPIQRGEQKITAITLRRPRAGELRGVKLMDLLQMDVAALHVVLPRVTSPVLTAHDVAALEPADMMQLGAEVSGFFMTKAAAEAAGLPA